MLPKFRISLIGLLTGCVLVAASLAAEWRWGKEAGQVASLITMAIALGLAYWRWNQADDDDDSGGPDEHGNWLRRDGRQWRKHTDWRD